MGTEDWPVRISLDGEWEAGDNRNYDRIVKVPGLAGDPKIMNDGTLWYRREVSLPEGNWTHATLILNGARFCPAIYVNSIKVSETAGGMTVTTHLLESNHVKPGERILLEIALKSLKDVDGRDASRIPEADHWRSNISSCLWDNVSLCLHGSSRITRLIPQGNIENGRVELYWELENISSNNGGLDMCIEIMDSNGRILSSKKQIHDEFFKKGFSTGKTFMYITEDLELWEPENPYCYRIRAALKHKGKVFDIIEIPLGMKDFRIEGLRFVLNSRPVTLRAGSVVWHRWVRDTEARELAFNTGWFEENIILRLKEHGANTLRFHLGTPPEALLDLCDKHGLMVQAEWIFFHGMEASLESLVEQWRSWLDLCMRHPSVCIIHPWNETKGEGLNTAFEALNTLAVEYPPLVISHRDVIHIHKYWWSIFENVGVHYDSASQFDKPVMADEFGGNYLDGDGNPGGYPALKESFLRFLGRNHTKELRLQLNTEANARIAEYWRRIGAAGFSPFCILGSPEDGNHHFLGMLKEGRPKPVWEALTAAYSPISCSLDIWDRNFLPDCEVTLPLYLFNETDTDSVLSVSVDIVPEEGECKPFVENHISCMVHARSTVKTEAVIRLPKEEGKWCFRAVLRNPPYEVKYPVISSWRFRIMKIKVPAKLAGIKIAVPYWEEELLDFLTLHSLKVDVIKDSIHYPIEDTGTKILVTSAITWEKIDNEPGIKNLLERAINAGCSTVMLDIDPGQVNLTDRNPRPLQGNMSVKNETELFGGIKIRFSEMREPESCIHPSDEGNSLWENLDRQATWLWNGLRGGLVIPASDMEVTGLSPDAFISLWVSRGADIEQIKAGSYYAFELSGFYAYSNDKDDSIVDALRSKVKFLMEDAPSLKITVNLLAPIRTFDLAGLYRYSMNSRARSFKALACCGKNLSRIPVLKIGFGDGEGKLILSQLLTKGRMVEGYGGSGFHDIRFDPAAVQFVLNLLGSALTD